jgi:hypothetical protein
MGSIIDKIKQALVNYLINSVLTKENVTKWITERLDTALENAKKSPETWDDPIVQRLHDIWEEISKTA